MNVYEMFCTEYECDSCPHLVYKKEDIVARDARLREKAIRLETQLNNVSCPKDDSTMVIVKGLLNEIKALLEAVKA